MYRVVGAGVVTVSNAVCIQYVIVRLELPEGENTAFYYRLAVGYHHLLVLYSERVLCNKQLEFFPLVSPLIS